MFSHDTLAGKFYLTTERLLMLRGDLFLFESAFSADRFRNKLGAISRQRGLRHPSQIDAESNRGFRCAHSFPRPIRYPAPPEDGTRP